MERALSRFDRADANADGKVTRDELQALRPIAPPGGRGRGGFGGGLARADANGDGVITRDVAKSALAVYDVDELGLDRLDRAVLSALTRSLT